MLSVSIQGGAERAKLSSRGLSSFHHLAKFFGETSVAAPPAEGPWLMSPTTGAPCGSCRRRTRSVCAPPYSAPQSPLAHLCTWSWLPWGRCLAVARTSHCQTWSESCSWAEEGTIFEHFPLWAFVLVFFPLGTQSAHPGRRRVLPFEDHRAVDVSWVFIKEAFQGCFILQEDQVQTYFLSNNDPLIAEVLMYTY